MAPLYLMLSSSVLTNFLGFLPTKLWAMVTPESIAGVSEKMVSVAISSDLLGMLKAGNLDLKCFLIGYLVEATAH